MDGKINQNVSSAAVSSVTTNTILSAASPTKVSTVIHSPNMTKKLLPMAAFFMAFATVMTLLLMYYDNTALRHHQFKINMSQDYEFNNVAQDNPQLVAYIKEMLLAPAKEPHHKPLEASVTLKDNVALIAKLFHNKTNGVFVEAGAYSDEKSSNTEWLERKLFWSGLLIQPEPTHYFNLRRHNRERSQAIHACLSPTPYPKEVTFPQDEKDGVKINSVHSNLIDDPSWFMTRVKCFPLYTLLLAMNRTRVDYLSLESNGTELQVLETIPFDKVDIGAIDIHLYVNQNEKDSIKEFLATRQYAFVQSFNNNSSYVFVRKKLH